MNVELPNTADDRDESGAVLILSVILMLILIAAAALAIDLGNWISTGDRAQSASDEISLAAVSELVYQERVTGDRTLAEAEALATAREVARQNGIDLDDPNIVFNITFTTDAFGVDHAYVTLTRNDINTIFAGMMVNNIHVTRLSDAAMSSCQATCGDEITLSPGFGFVDTGLGGDGWMSVGAGNRAYNMFHHKTSNVLMCADQTTGSGCPGYPKMPYSGMKTNYTPILVPIDEKIYFVVQTSSAVGLGCWDGATAATCTGWSSPKMQQSYKQNSAEEDSRTRWAGPVLVGNRLFMYGDDNKMYCFDLNTNAVCAGYPKATTLAGSKDMDLVKKSSGFAGGVDADDGLQFDMLVRPNGYIYTSLTPAANATWISCWNTNTNATCPSWSNISTGNGRVFLFFHYNTSGVENGICARTGNRGGDEVGSGHQCYTFAGASLGSPIPISFDHSGSWKAGQQEVTVVPANGHTYTFFPVRGQDKAYCWDWTTTTACAIPATNWDDTQDYAYWWDGAGECIFGNGDDGILWSFSINTGQSPCVGDTVTEVITPCLCADGVTPRWTRIELTGATSLDHFDSFVLTLTRPNGSVFFTGDLVTLDPPVIDLTPLNAESPIPTSLTVSLDTSIKAGHEASAFEFGLPGVVAAPDIRPTLTE